MVEKIAPSFNLCSTAPLVGLAAWPPITVLNPSHKNYRLAIADGKSHNRLPHVSWRTLVSSLKRVIPSSPGDRQERRWGFEPTSAECGRPDAPSQETGVRCQCWRIVRYRRTHIRPSRKRYASDSSVRTTDRSRSVSARI